MNKKRKILFSLASATVLVLSGCGEEKKTALDLTLAPDYTNKKAEFITFGYAPPTGGIYYENGLTIDQGIDFRTPERYKEYKDCGMNVLMFQSEDNYDYQNPWETSDLKRKMDYVTEAGINKIIVCDSRIYDLCNTETPLICQEGKEPQYLTIGGNRFQGGIKQFANINELSKFIGGLMENYYKHPSFFGVIIRDEPFINYLDNWCTVYKAISLFDEDIFIQGNLLPYMETEQHLPRLVPEPLLSTLVSKFKTKPKEAMTEAYKYYLKYYLDHSGAKKILMDSYPFLANNAGPYMSINHLVGLQIIGELCKEYDVGFQGVAQTYGGKSGGANGTRTHDVLNAASMQWQLNTYMGYRADAFGYFTYWRKVMNNNVEWYNDGESFITNNGERTQLYYTMQTIHEEVQKMAPVLTNFKYTASTSFVQEPCSFSTQYIDINEEELQCFSRTDFSANEGTAALVTEMKDKNNGQYLYMVMNAANPSLKVDIENLMLNYSIDFGSEYNAVEVYYRGERYIQPLDNGVYRSSLDAGYADYIMPFKA